MGSSANVESGSVGSHVTDNVRGIVDGRAFQKIVFKVRSNQPAWFRPAGFKKHWTDCVVQPMADKSGVANVNTDLPGQMQHSVAAT
jgi:hypothetical protein